MATYAEVTKILTFAAAAYPTFQLKKATVDTYAELLADIDAEQLATATKQAASDSKFFPTVAELRERVHGMRAAACNTPEAAEAWRQVCAAVRFNERGVGYWAHRETCSTLAIQAAEAYGLTRIATRLDENTGTDYAQFRDTFQAFARRAESEARRLPGTNAMIKQLAERLDMGRRLLAGATDREGPEVQS